MSYDAQYDAMTTPTDCRLCGSVCVPHANGLCESCDVATPTDDLPVWVCPNCGYENTGPVCTGGCLTAGQGTLDSDSATVERVAKTSDLTALRIRGAMMERYRRKPIVVEAERFRYDRYDDLKGKYGLRQEHSRDHHERLAWMATRDGERCVCDGDWIITESNGECYPCKSDLFSATFEPEDGVDLRAILEEIVAAAGPGSDGIVDSHRFNAAVKAARHLVRAEEGK